MNRIVSEVKHLVDTFNNSQEELIVLSTYFTSKQDPVRAIAQASDNFGYIKNWYESILKLGLRAVIFCDSLSEDFIARYQNDRVSFVRCSLGHYSLNDERFFIFREFIEKLKSDTFILTTDINDVIINKDPQPLLHSKSEKLLIGRGNRKVWKNGIWTLTALRQFSQKFNQSLPISFLQYPVFNPGTIGGKKGKVLELFTRMTQVFEVLGDDENYDMPVFNYVLKKYYYPKSNKYDGKIPFGLAWNFWFYIYRIQRKLEKEYRKEKYDLSNHQESIEENDLIYAGYPFVSMFSWYESQTDAYLIHK